jgi:alkylation response protein AidB-like acyl-CoA dehydrogenase
LTDPVVLQDELGRLDATSRPVRLAIRGFELGVAYAQQRKTFGKVIAEHQAILFRIAEMATKVETIHTMMVRAARLKDTGWRTDVEARMAKMLASEYANEVVEELLPHPWRLRLLQGVRDRAPHAQGRFHAHRRGHQH